MNPIKAYEIRSASDRIRYHNAVERIRRKHQRSMRTSLRNVFNLQRMMIESIEGDITVSDVQRVLEQTYVPMTKVFESTYLQIADDVYPMTVKKFDRGWHPSSIPLMPSSKRDYDSDLAYQAAVRKWIIENCGEKIREIDGTTLRQVKRCYDKAHNQIEFRQMMSELFDNSITPFRSNAIARTETAVATNRCSLETMNSTGFDGQKVWSAVLDMDTRDTHAMIDGMTVGIKEQFKWVVPDTGIGVMMDCPGDHSYGAPADQIINCRCSILYEY